MSKVPKIFSGTINDDAEGKSSARRLYDWGGRSDQSYWFEDVGVGEWGSQSFEVKRRTPIVWRENDPGRS